MAASTQPTRASLTAVNSTMVLTLYFRMWDAEKPEPIVGDTWATSVLQELSRRGYRKPLAKRAGFARYGPLLRGRRLDLWTRAYLDEHPDTVVLHLGSGLDSRAFRLDIPDTTEWYDLDMPDVIDLRREVYPSAYVGRPGYQMIGSSVTDPDWIQRYVPADRRLLVIAEGLLMYLDEPEIRRLARSLVEHSSQGELWFDSLPAAFVKQPFARLFPVNRLFRWGLSSPNELEQWHPQLQLTEQAPIATDHALLHHAGARFVFRQLARTARGSELLQLSRLQWRNT